MAFSDDLDLDDRTDQPTREQWSALVDGVLKGGSFDRLVTTTLDGLRIDPLHTGDDAAGTPEQFPGAGHGVRGHAAAGLVEHGWDIRTRAGLDDPTAIADLNRLILDDLEGGATSIELGTPALLDGEAGVDQLDRALDGVLLDLAPVSIRSGWWYRSAADVLLALVERRGLPASAALGELGVDPLGHLADHGELHVDVSRAYDDVAEIAERAGNHPQMRSIRVGVERYAAAGATEAQELAAALATGVAYTRAMTDRGSLDVSEAFGQLVVGLTASADQFLTIAKLRAFRRAWGRIADLAGADAGAAMPRLHVTTLPTMMSRRDPWVNMLRATTACFGAAVGGADIITVMPFDSPLGVPDEMGRRLARNTQLILLEETQLNRVIDPAGGSWYVEDLTEQLAAAAWERFTAIEAAGGMADAITSGRFAADIDRVWNERATTFADRSTPLTGVSEFPNLDEDLPARAPYPAPARPAPQIGATATAIRPRSGAAIFDRIRTRAETAEAAPTVFLANLGPVAVHNARATFATNIFAVGGIRAEGSEAHEDSGHDDADGAATAFASSGSRVACICSSDRTYREHAGATATALRAAGAEHVFLAGAPGEHESEWRAAGIDGFVHIGCDVVAVLEQTLDTLGVPA